jgi:hypothetical protein
MRKVIGAHFWFFLMRVLTPFQHQAQSTTSCPN